MPDHASAVNRENRDVVCNAYDNSVLYTDYFLHSLIGILKNSGADATMIYSPDHGEDLLDDSRKRFLHASPIPTYYQIHIPFLMWFSENYIDARPEKYEVARYNSSAPISSNASIFHTLLNMAEIQTPYFDSTYSLVNPGFVRRPRMYLGDHDQPVNYYEVGLKKQDKEMILKRGMDYSIE